MEEQKVIQNRPLTFAVRQSRFILISNLILIIGGFLILLVLAALLLNISNSLFFDGTLPTVKIMGLLMLIFIVMGIFLAIRAYFDWKTTYYIICPREFTIHKGIFNKIEEKYELNQVEKINVLQGFLGRIFNYGSIDMSNPMSGNVGRINNIPNPSKYQRVLLQPSSTELNDPIRHIPPLEGTPSPFSNPVSVPNEQEKI